MNALQLGAIWPGLLGLRPIRRSRNLLHSNAMCLASFDNEKKKKKDKARCKVDFRAAP
jgi:hypothetical protein